MLYLISLGLYDEKDMSLRALAVAKKCDKLYAEFYTNKMFTDAKKLTKTIGKHVIELKRNDLEEKSETIIKEAKTKNVGIFVGGDALVATTHISLLIDAKKQKIKTNVIHGSSIYSAIAETGLQIYMFGKTTTLALPERNYSPTSCYETIVSNSRMGLHTLVLLDIKNEKRRYMDVHEGLKILLDIEKNIKKRIVSPETKIVSACQLGGNETIKYGKIKDLIKDEELKNKTPAVLIIPGKLHFTEKEYLETLK